MALWIHHIGNLTWKEAIPLCLEFANPLLMPTSTLSMDPEPEPTTDPEPTPSSNSDLRTHDSTYIWLIQ